MASARLLHDARRMTDVSRWWTLRWTSNAVSLLSRACEIGTGKSCKLFRKLRRITTSYASELWLTIADRRHDANDHIEKEAVKAKWLRLQRLLGRAVNKRGLCMPGWVLVKNQPIYKIRSQLLQWKKAKMTLIRADGQKRMTAFVSRTVTRNVTPTSKRRSDTNNSLGGHSETGKKSKVQSRLSVNASNTVGARPRNSTPPASLSCAPSAAQDTSIGTRDVTVTHLAAHTELTATEQSQQTTLASSSQSGGPRVASTALPDNSVTVSAPTGLQLHGPVSLESDSGAAPSDGSDDDDTPVSCLVAPKRKPADKISKRRIKPRNRHPPPPLLPLLLPPLLRPPPPPPRPPFPLTPRPR